MHGPNFKGCKRLIVSPDGILSFPSIARQTERREVNKDGRKKGRANKAGQQVDTAKQEGIMLGK